MGAVESTPANSDTLHTPLLVLETPGTDDVEVRNANGTLSISRISIPEQLITSSCTLTKSGSSRTIPILRFNNDTGMYVSAGTFILADDTQDWCSFSPTAIILNGPLYFNRTGGSASENLIHRQSDLTTGWYSPGSNSWSACIAGNPIFLVDSNGISNLPLLTLSAGLNLGNDDLTDYVEGSFTPTLTALSGFSSGPTFNAGTGKYVRIGNIVHVRFYFTAQNSSNGTPIIFTASVPITTSNTIIPYGHVNRQAAWGTTVGSAGTGPSMPYVATANPWSPTSVLTWTDVSTASNQGYVAGYYASGALQPNVILGYGHASAIANVFWCVHYTYML